MTGDRDRHAVERLERDFDRAKRVLVPNLSDWTQAGPVLARLAAKYDYEQIGRGRLTNDALIAIKRRAVRHYGHYCESSGFRQGC